ncbi:MAG: glycosyltransferase family 4 protein [Planctomycetaceae bacterium]|nr:glycosyltransferase family 4 protein [Planctomycetaceae bacterium]
MSRPKLLYINRSYWPDSEATGQLLTDLCEDLADEFDVTVLVGLPNHVADGMEPPRPGTSTHNGVTIRRVRHTQFGKHSFWGRILNLVSFTLAAFWASLWLPVRPDVVITETDPFFLPLLGRFLKWRYRCRFVAYLQDIYPDIAVAVGKVREGWITWFLRRQLVGAYQQADKVIVLSSDMQNLSQRNGVDAQRLTIIPNWIDTSTICPRGEINQFRQQENIDDYFVVMYSGNMGVGHLLEPVLDAADQLQNRAEILFVLIGEGQQKVHLQQRAERLGLKNVRFLPYQPREFLSESLSGADCHLVSVRPEVVECLMPSKLYGVLAAGVPSIALAPADCELSTVVETNAAGIVCPTDNPDNISKRIAAAVEKLCDDGEFRRRAGKSARQLAVEHYDRRIVTKQHAELLHGLMSGEV